MLTTASLASASHPRTPLRDARATVKEEPSPITPGEIYSAQSFIERENVRKGNFSANEASNAYGQPRQARGSTHVYRQGLQQPLFHLLLAGDAVLGPRYRLEPLLLQLFLAVRAHAVFIRVDALQRRVDHVQDRAVRIGHAKEELLRVGVRCLVREINRRIFIRGSSLFLRSRDCLHQLLAPYRQLLLVVFEPFLVHGSPAPLSAFGAI